METGNLIHLGAELVVQMLMLYSTSPHARRLASEMITGDPFDIDVKLDMKAKNRNAEILNVYLKTIGLKIVFRKIPKKKPYPILISPFEMFDQGPKVPFATYPGEVLNPESISKQLVDINNRKYPLEVYPFAKMDDIIDE